MRLTKDKKVMLIGIPATRNGWLWECLKDELINDINVYEEYFQVPHRGMLFLGDQKRTSWPPHTNNITVSSTCKLDRSSYQKIVTIRDPWERYVGLFEFLSNNPEHAMRKRTRNWNFENFLFSVSRGDCTFDLVPQVNYLYNHAGKMDFDRIFKFEQMTEIKKYFTEKGYKFQDIPVTSKPKNLASYYTDETKKLVGTMCWFEATFFGYRAPELSGHMVAE